MENEEQRIARAELLANVKSFQKLAEVGDVRPERYELFVNAVGEYLRAEEEQAPAEAALFRDFATVATDLADAVEPLIARLRSTAAIIRKASQ